MRFAPIFLAVSLALAGSGKSQFFFVLEGEAEGAEGAERELGRDSDLAEGTKRAKTRVIARSLPRSSLCLPCSSLSSFATAPLHALRVS